MSDIVNLRLARKRKARVERERIAEQNRLLHGRTKAEQFRNEIERGRSASLLDGHRREKPPKDGKP